jgi:tryptophan synthase alpha chain
MSRLQSLFTTRTKILSVYFTAGFPRLNDTLPILEALEANGANLVELGIPYSDPMADGPTIQESSSIALKNGMCIDLLFEQIAAMRKTVTIPVVLMSYFNPTYLYGFERFCEQAAKVGIDGLIIPDLPLHEFEGKYKEITTRYNLSFNMLITSHTPNERIRQIDTLTDGFLYLVSSAATTGNTNELQDTQLSFFERVSKMQLKNPLMVGFGVHNRSTFNDATKFCNGAIIGSAFIRALKQSDDVAATTKQFLDSIRNGA